MSTQEKPGVLDHQSALATTPGASTPTPSGLFGSVRTRDFDELAAAFRRWKQQFRQLGRGPFAGELQFLQIGGVQVFRASVNRVIHVQGSPPPNSFMFVPVVSKTEGARWRGRRRKSGDINILTPGREVDHLTSADYQIVGMSVDANLFRECAAVLGGFDLEERLGGDIGVASGPATCRALSAHLVGLLRQAEFRPNPMVDVGRLAAQECVRRLIGVIGKANGMNGTEHRRANPELLVRRAEDFVRTSLGGPLSMLDLCRELGVSERTLLYAFKEVRGVSPIAYFKALRLNAVRQELKAAEFATVHEVARRWGFFHTGEFAADYRRLFGELPGQALGNRSGVESRFAQIANPH